MKKSMGGTYLTMLVLLLQGLTAQSQNVTTDNNCVREGNTTYRCENRIPKAVPQGCTNVILEHFEQDMNLNSSMFNTPGWGHVTDLVVGSPWYNVLNQIEVSFGYQCFSELVNLEYLSIHVKLGDIMNGSFHGLNNVHTLNLSCVQNVHEHYLQLILAPDSLPNIKTLIMRDVDIQHSNLYLNEYFWRSLFERSVAYVDISSEAIVTNMSSFYSYCDNIETFIVRGTHVIKAISFTKQPCRKLNYVDVSEVKFTDMIVCSLDKPLIYNKSEIISLADLYVLSNVETIIADDICTKPSKQIHITDEARIRFKDSFDMKTLSVRGNNLVYLDIRILCETPSLQNLTLADNNMEYMSPDLLACVFTLKYLDLSNNSLGLMSIYNKTKFRGLLEPLYNLVNVNLANNRLSCLPIGIFSNNTKLEVINLSDNSLSQIEFVFQPPKSFIAILLSRNKIEVFNSISMHNLDIMLRNNSATIHIDGNQLSCRKCSDLTSVAWIFELKTRVDSLVKLKCKDEDDNHVFVDGRTIAQVQTICKRPITIVIWCSVGVGTLVVTCLLVCVVRKTKYKRRRKQNISNVINMIQEDQEGFNFALFLSFSSNNYCLVEEHIKPSLEQELRQHIGIDRELICIGDKHFRPGMPIVMETIRCLQMSHVAMFVVTNDFCHSEYSMDEVRQACQLKKRIILMIEEDTNIEIMSADLRHHFENNARIVWSFRNEELILKTTWKHVCSCILDL